MSRQNGVSAFRARGWLMLGLGFLLMTCSQQRLCAQPANDACTAATIIPGSSDSYTVNNLNMGNALFTICDPFQSCAGGSISKNVFYEYTPDLDGTVIVDTFGSNFDTVLSAFSGCRGLCSVSPISCCTAPIEYACNDNYFFGNQSQITVEVEGGQTYVFAIGAIGSTGSEQLDFHLRWKPSNDACANATVIGGTVYDSPPISTVNTDVDACEAQESCEFNNVGTSNSVWYSYTPVCDGYLTLDTSDSDYDTVVSVFDGCGIFYGVDIPCGVPSEIACDDDSGIGTRSRITDLPVSGGVEYLIKVSDYNTALGGGYLQFHLEFDGADPPIAQVTSPASSQCACNPLTITGTAQQPAGIFDEWVLDYRPVDGSTWTLIAGDSVEVVDGTLAVLNTLGLAEGAYLLRLTVTNGCGLSSSDVAFFYVDHQFASLDLTQPNNIIVGGDVCPHGTAWDVCFDHYTLEYSPSGLGTYQLLDPGVPMYLAAITNDPLTPGQTWDTVTLGIPDGDYDMRLTGVTSCGFDERVTTFTVDNTAPVAQIDSPLPCDVVSGLVQVFGTADDANLAGWSLQYAPDSGGGWVTIDSGVGPVNNGVLGMWDTTGLPSCAYALRLLATDSASLNCNGAIHHQSEDVLVVQVGGCSDFDSDLDGDVDATDYNALVMAMTGPLSIGPVVGSCGDMDVDNDGDTDLVDYNAFTKAYTGPLP